MGSNKMILNLDDDLSVEVVYGLQDDEVIITDIRLTEGELMDMIYLELEGFESLNAYLADKISENLLLSFNEMNELSGEELDEKG